MNRTTPLIKPCKSMPFDERVGRVYQYRFRTGDEAKGQFSPGTCRVCGHPLPFAWVAYKDGVRIGEYALGTPASDKLNARLEAKRLHGSDIDGYMVFPVTVCESIAELEVWIKAGLREEERKRELERAKQEVESTRRGPSKPIYAGGNY